MSTDNNAAAATQSKPGDDTPLQSVSMEWAQARILRNLFLRFDGTRPDLQPKLEKAYEDLYGVSMLKVTKRFIRPIYMESEPGQGKTTTHEEACRQFAELMGLKFIANPTLTQMMSGKIDHTCFVFSTVNIGGATSKHEIGGLMAKLSVNGQPFMGHLPDWRMGATMLGAYGYALVDDFITAAPPAQNACLDLFLGGSAGDLAFTMREVAASNISVKNGELALEFDEEKDKKLVELNGGEHQIAIRGVSPVHIGVAANFGVRDGNEKTFPLSTALANRVERYRVSDTVEAWISRSIKNHPHEIGDAYYSSFMRQNPDLFSVIPKRENQILSQMPTSRSHDALADAIVHTVHHFGGMAAISKDPIKQRDVIDEIERLAGAHIGVRIETETKQKDGSKLWVFPARAVSSFYTELFIGAVPLAESIIREGKVDEEEIKNKYNSGMDDTGINFGYNYAAALAQIAATAFSEKIDAFTKNLKGKGDSAKKIIQQLEDPESPLSKDVRETLSRLSMGASFLQAHFAGFALERFNQRLATQKPEIFQGTTYKILPPETMKTMVFGLIRDNTKYNTAELQEAFIDAITGAAGAINAEHKGGRNRTIDKTLQQIKDAERSAKAQGAARAALGI